MPSISIKNKKKKKNINLTGGLNKIIETKYTELDTDKPITSQMSHFPRPVSGSKELTENRALGMTPVCAEQHWLTLARNICTIYLFH